MTDIVTTDVVVIGGGIAGLWLNYRLRRAGYSTILLEKDTLGGGQSIRSQGIIHGGTKYALNGALTTAANAISDMPSRWRACLNGEGDVDLSQARILSEHHYMWSKAQLASRLTTFFASKAVRGRIDALKDGERPQAFQNSRFKGKLYALNELVLDVPSVVQALAEPFADGIYQIDCSQPGVVDFDGEQIKGICIQSNRRSIRVEAQCYVLAAGEGNEALLHGSGIPGPAMQRRPLHMVIVKHDYPNSIFAHCIATGSKPLLTITTHRAEDGKYVWYLGGNLAETGVELSGKEQIEKARELVAELLPWIDLGDAQWGSFFINRAEPRQSNLLRPDNAYVARIGNALTCWPTKLALSPNLSDEVLGDLEKQGLKPQVQTDYSTLAGLPRPSVSRPIWEQLLS